MARVPLSHYRNDELTPEQIAELEAEEAQLLDSLAQAGMPVELGTVPPSRGGVQGQAQASRGVPKVPGATPIVTSEHAALLDLAKRQEAAKNARLAAARKKKKAAAPTPSEGVLKLVTQLDARGEPFDLQVVEGAARPDALEELVPTKASGPPAAAQTPDALEELVPAKALAPASAPAPAPPAQNLGGYAQQLRVPYDPRDELTRLRAEPKQDLRTLSDTMVDDQGNLFGYEHKPAFDPRAAMARAGELYDQTPTTDSHRWEEEFLSNRARTTDQDIQRAFLAQTMVNGPEQAMRMREMMRREQSGYDEGLEAARQKDLATGRISRAGAEGIASMGISPESAAQLRQNDPLAKG
jgi:hypothetical protein